VIPYFPSGCVVEGDEDCPRAAQAVAMVLTRSDISVYRQLFSIVCRQRFKLTPLEHCFAWLLECNSMQAGTARPGSGRGNRRRFR